MKWSDEGIFQLVEQYRKKTNFYKIGIHLCVFSVGIIYRLCVSWFLAPDNAWRLFLANVSSTLYRAT